MITHTTGTQLGGIKVNNLLQLGHQKALLNVKIKQKIKGNRIDSASIRKSSFAWRKFSFF